MFRFSLAPFYLALVSPLLLAGCGDSDSSSAAPPTPLPEEVPLLDWNWLPAPQLIDTDGTTAGRPNGVIGVTGDASLVWRRDGTGPLSCGAMAYYGINTTSWDGESAGLVDCGDLDTGEVPQVGMDVNGNAMTVWVTHQAGGDYARIRSSVREADGDWSAAVDVSGSPQAERSAANPSLFVPGSGNPTLVWQQNAGSSYGYYDNLFISTFDTQTGTWSSQQNLNYQGGPLSNYEHHSRSPVLAGNQNGELVLAYTQEEGWDYGQPTDPEPQVRAVIYKPGDPFSEWQHHMKLSELATLPHNIRAFMDADGNATVLWIQDDSGNENLYARRYDAVDGWDASPTQLESVSGDVGEMDAAIDANGDIMVVWRQWIAEAGALSSGPSALIAQTERLRYSRFDSDSDSWSTASGIHADTVEPLGLAVDVDQNGNAMLAWEGNEGYQISASRYEAATDTWRAPELLSEDFSDPMHEEYGEVDDVLVFVNDEGYTGVGWQQHNGTSRRIYAIGLR